MRKIKGRFNEFGRLFPDQIAEFSTELQTMEMTVSDIFNIDLKKMKKTFNEKNLNINLKRFKEETYLLLYSLYLRNQRPKRDRDIIQFFLANMFICKNVIVRIVRYIVRLLPNIQQSITDYNERKDNRLIKIFHEFTGYCNNISIVISEYLFFQEKIWDRLEGVLGPRIMELPNRDKIREGVQECLAKTTNAQYVSLPLVRLALELPILEDIGIQIKHKLNERRRRHKIKDIMFTQNIKLDDLTSLMRKMFPGNDDVITVVDRIHKWGSKSVHRGQTVPISVIWFSLFFVWNKLPPMFAIATTLSYKSIKKEYDELIHDHKVRAIEEDELFDPTFSNF
jgi:hypothetical protein